MARARLVTAAAVAVLAAACTRSQPYPLPDRADPAVVAEESRIAALLGRNGATVTPPARCDVRLLGRDGAVSYAWAACDNGTTQTSGPVRVTGEAVARPDDGSGYAPSVKRLFPEGLAREILRHEARLRP